ncbi:MAG: hypothetical protein V3R32_02025 [Nitrosomonadaceae bacterium]
MFVLISAVIIFGIVAFYGNALYVNPVERSSFICRAGDGTVHPEESLLGCGWFFDSKHCTNGPYVDNTYTELEG